MATLTLVSPDECDITSITSPRRGWSERYTAVEVTDLVMPSQADMRWIRTAMRTAESGAGNYRLGAVVVRSGSVLGTGSNRHRNDPATAYGVERSGWSTHAEEACLRTIRDGRARGATIYVARISPAGEARLARPCAACQDAARQAGITKMVYTTTNGLAAERINMDSLTD